MCDITLMKRQSISETCQMRPLLLGRIVLFYESTTFRWAQKLLWKVHFSLIHRLLNTSRSGHWPRESQACPTYSSEPTSSSILTKKQCHTGHTRPHPTRPPRPKHSSAQSICFFKVCHAATLGCEQKEEEDQHWIITTDVQSNITSDVKT
jgi:hypothetical protein